VRAVYASDANFLLVRHDDPDALLHTLASAGIVVRDMRHLPGLDDAVRITIGTDDEMTDLDTALDIPLGETDR
jgi:histidinol-phosphate aminotransferase